MRLQTIFLAIARRSVPDTAPLLEDLEAVGYAVMLDVALPGGDAWWDDVTQRIRELSVFAYGISIATLDSEICQVQVDFAVSLHKQILPIEVETGIPDSSLPPSSHCSGCRTPSRTPGRFTNLFRTINRLTPTVGSVPYEVPASPATCPGSPWHSCDQPSTSTPRTRRRSCAAWTSS